MSHSEHLKISKPIIESIADLTRRPLFTMTSGHLAGPPPLVEIRLVEQITLATRWNALVLLDEADVFMQERNLQDLDRNSLVSSEYMIPRRNTIAVDQVQYYYATLNTLRGSCF